MGKYLELQIMSLCVAIKICVKVQQNFTDELAVSQTTEF